MPEFTVLISNDDGVDSPFLPPLVEALAAHFRIVIAVPARENSWIWRAMTRRGPVLCEETTVAGFPAFALGGTPTDCVNIALSHLFAPKPDLIVSGINIGYNTTTPLIYSSGTVAAALEGAAWGLPAIAASQALVSDVFRQVSNREGLLSEETKATIRASAAATAAFAVELMDPHRPAADLVVHNLNFPFPFAGGPLVSVKPARVHRGGLFTPDADGAYHFAYHEGTPRETDQPTDLSALQAGQANHAVLNFGSLS